MTDDTPDDEDPIEQETDVRRSDVGVSITTEIKRGTSTRDQDKHTVKAKGETFDEARFYHEQAMDYLDGGGDGPVLDRVRRWNPDRSGGGA